MPFIANTPESLVARTDSKNPATTCRGITSAGRPCRRPLASSDTPVIPPPVRKSSSKTHHNSLRVDDPRDERLYCWQHKEQAAMSTRPNPGHHASPATIAEERTSLDTLADRLGLMSISSAHRPSSRPGQTSYAPGRPKGRSLFWCCLQPSLDEEPAPPPPRPSQQPVQTGSPSHHRPNHPTSADTQRMKPHRPQPASAPNATGHHPPKSSAASSMPPQMAQHASVVPRSASPQTTAHLMAELAKPISQTDEPGYIYMFWLTPESGASAPPAGAARSLLVPSGQPAAGGQHRAGDVLASFAAMQPARTRGVGGTDDNRDSRNSTSTLLLKIGRANNVQRRLNEWKRQCGYDLSLIRYYPYIPSVSAGSGDGDPSAILPRKLPHSHKVERLIHIELAGRGLRIMDGEKCAACNREHREWFQVEASRKAVMEVDDTIRRWSDWDEGRLQGASE